MRAVLDKSLYGDRVIVTKTLDGAKHTIQFKLEGPCESCSTNRSKGSNLAALCTSDFQVSSTEINVLTGYGVDLTFIIFGGTLTLTECFICLCNHCL